VGQISILEAAVADQIAAGEVVERPASVCKELVENSLDAGARTISVDLEEGGVMRLCVTDDGSGMDQEDAVLCFSRHATSKLRRAEDLHAIRSFGFRGEALAAIASVAKVSLTTRRRDDATAQQVTVEGARVTGVREAGAPVGTRVDVRELFFNVPARRKFLKTLRTEAGHVEDALLAVGLCRPDVGVQLRTDGKLVLDLPAVPDAALALDSPARVDRVVRCLGEHLRSSLYPVRGQTDLLTLSGYVVAPIETRRDLQGVHLSVNGRPVTDRQLVQAVRAAFRTLLEVGRQPIVALDVALDPALVDVNVHPRKAEVRFADPRRVSGHLISLLSEFLHTTPWLNRGTHNQTVYRLRGNAGLTVASDEQTSDAPIVGEDPAEAHRARVKAALAAFGQAADRRDVPPSAVAQTALSSSSSPSSTMALPTLESQPGRGGASSFSALRVVGQVGGTYLILEGPDGMVVIDQHAAHERVVFERLRDRRRGQGQPSQALLLPITIELTARERAALDDVTVKAELARAGLDLDGYAHTTAIVRALPPGLDGRKAHAIVRDVLAELSDHGGGSGARTLEERDDAICARLACHAAVRAGDVMAPAQVRALLQDLDTIDLGAHCPHGRPVVRTLDYTELAAWFDRD